MSEQFDAVEYLLEWDKSLGGSSSFLQCADELAAAKARISEQGMFIVQLESRLNDIAGDWQAKELQLTAEQAISRKLYEALNRMLTHMGMDEDEFNSKTFSIAREAIAEYEGRK